MLQKEREALEEIEIAEASAMSMQPDMAMIDKYQSELRENERKIIQQQSKIGGLGEFNSFQKCKLIRHVDIKYV